MYHEISCNFIATPTLPHLARDRTASFSSSFGTLRDSNGFRWLENTPKPPHIFKIRLTVSLATVLGNCWTLRHQAKPHNIVPKHHHDGSPSCCDQEHHLSIDPNSHATLNMWSCIFLEVQHLKLRLREAKVDISSWLLWLKSFIPFVMIEAPSSKTSSSQESLHQFLLSLLSPSEARSKLFVKWKIISTHFCMKAPNISQNQIQQTPN